MGNNSVITNKKKKLYYWRDEYNNLKMRNALRYREFFASKVKVMCTEGKPKKKNRALYLYWYGLRIYANLTAIGLLTLWIPSFQEYHPNTY